MAQAPDRCKEGKVLKTELILKPPSQKSRENLWFDANQADHQLKQKKQTNKKSPRNKTGFSLPK